MLKYGKRVIAAALTGVLFIGVGQVGAPEISSKGKIKLSKTMLTISVGAKATIKLKNVKKKNVSKIRWTTSNKKVAKVSPAKKSVKTTVKGIAPGNAKIIAKLSGKKYICKVKVKAKEKIWKETLEALDGVSKVETVPINEGQNFFQQKYIVTFDQPLDWKDPSRGTFPQRVEVGLSDSAEINVLETNGYALNDIFYGKKELLGADDQPEMTHLITKSGNYFNIEHRFFGGSKPADMSNSDTKYWEYHTPENAANDYHKIFTTLAPVFGDRWVSVGTSRGGLMTNVYAKYFPDDMMAYIPYVAPCSDGLDGDSMYRFVYEEIGDVTYGKEQAKKYRDIITAFQVDLLKNKEIILETLYHPFINDSRIVFQNGLTDYSKVYDVNVLEVAVQMWQYSSKQQWIESLSDILSMPENTEEEKIAKLAKEFMMLLNVQSPQDWSITFVAWPYYVNTAMYYGQYHYDFSYLRKAMKEAGVKDTLSVTPEQEKSFVWDILFTPEQRKQFVYDGTFRKEIIEDMKTTKAKHLMIFGASDPWISQSVPEEATAGNENIKRYVNPNYPHDSTITNMPEDKKAEIISLLEGWLEP